MASHTRPSRLVDRYESALFATSSTPSRGAKNAFSTTSSCPPVTLNGVWLSWSDRDQAAAGMTPPA